MTCDRLMLVLAAVAWAFAPALGAPLQGHPSGHSSLIVVPHDTLGLRPIETPERFTISPASFREDPFAVPSLAEPAWAFLPLGASAGENTDPISRARAGGTASLAKALTTETVRPGAVTLADILDDDESYDNIGRLFPNERSLGVSGLARFIPAPGAAAPVAAGMLVFARRRRP